MELTPWTFAIVLPLVALAGFVDAAAGGGGLISLPAYLAAGLPAQLASGTNKMGSVFGTALATAKYAREGRIAWRAAIPAVVGALPGAALGARLHKRRPRGILRYAVAQRFPHREKIVQLLVLRRLQDLLWSLLRSLLPGLFRGLRRRLHRRGLPLPASLRPGLYGAGGVPLPILPVIRRKNVNLRLRLFLHSPLRPSASGLFSAALSRRLFPRRTFTR